MRGLISVIAVLFLAGEAKANLKQNLYECGPAALKAGRFQALSGNGDPCRTLGTTEPYLLYVHLHRAMYVCENGVATWANYVAGGRNGFRKRRQGDKKVPEGIYQLGAPRPSANYGIFIPIMYPNADDVAAGRTGGNIGIHGPKRAYACDSTGNLFTPWTDGCLAYPSDRHIYELARWVMAHPTAFIVLREM